MEKKLNKPEYITRTGPGLHHDDHLEYCGEPTCECSEESLRAQEERTRLDLLKTTLAILKTDGKPPIKVFLDTVERETFHTLQSPKTQQAVECLGAMQNMSELRGSMEKNEPEYVTSTCRGPHYMEKGGRPPCECLNVMLGTVEERTKPDLVERTLAIIKPDGITHIREILDIIDQEGFHIVQKRKLILSPEQVSDIYEDHYGQAYFPLLVTHVSSGPIYAMCLAKDNAVEEWKRVIGPRSVTEAIREYPDSIRGRFGDPKYDVCNVVHGSATRADAQKELHYFFPEMILEPLLTGKKAIDYLEQKVNPTLLEGLVSLCKEKPRDPVTWLADWLLANNPNNPLTDED